jgi:hypothetical protein
LYIWVADRKDELLRSLRPGLAATHRQLDAKGHGRRQRRRRQPDLAL